MMSRRSNPKAEYRLQQSQRANDSVSFAEKFPKLKTLTVDLAFFEANGLTKNGAMRYKVNVGFAKSLFSFACSSGECFGGDFDLSAAVAEAVNARRKTAEGQIRCEGCRAKPKEQTVPCRNILRYKLTLGYV